MWGLWIQTNFFKDKTHTHKNTNCLKSHFKKKNLVCIKNLLFLQSIPAFLYQKRRGEAFIRESVFIRKYTINVFMQVSKPLLNATILNL